MPSAKPGASAAFAGLTKLLMLAQKSGSVQGVLPCFFNKSLNYDVYWESDISLDLI